MPRYHFVVRTPDHTHDDPDGMDFPNLEAANATSPARKAAPWQERAGRVRSRNDMVN